MTNSQREALIYAKQHRLYEKRIRPLFLSALQKQVQPVIDWIERFGIETTIPVNELIPVDVFRVPMRRAYEMVAVTAARREYYNQRGQEEKGLLDILVNRWKQIFNDYAIEYAYRIENELAETTRQLIRDALKEAYEQKLNAERTITMIKRSVQGIISRRRATLIARTESGTAAMLGKTTGAKEYFKETNQSGYKEYIGRMDERERNSHRHLEGQIIPIDDNFEFQKKDGGTELAPYPCATTLSGENRIQCRCTVVFMSARRYERMQAEKK